ncbi:MAG TPA: transposase, partial [Dehalococcoidia bacterium]|nr:transposase [Dehalococcoidia bacterium]
MTTQDFITELFCKVDDQMPDLPRHPQANLSPSEVTTIGLLHAIKGVGNRAFYRWLADNHLALFPQLPHRTRLFRLLRRHQDWCLSFLAQPTLLGVIDTYGIELVHPIREGRSEHQMGE